MHFKYSVMETMLKAFICLGPILVCLAAPNLDRTDAEIPAGLEGCQLELEGQIRSCMHTFTATYIDYTAPNRTELEKMGLLRSMCREYGESLQCLHVVLLHCNPTHYHLDLIAAGVGHIRTLMEDACHQVTAEDWDERLETTTGASTTSSHQTSSRVTSVMGTSAGSTEKVAVSTIIPATRTLADGVKNRPVGDIDILSGDTKNHGDGNNQRVSLHQGPRYRTKTKLHVADVSEVSVMPTKSVNDNYDKRASPFVADASQTNFMHRNSEQVHKDTFTNSGVGRAYILTWNEIIFVSTIWFTFSS